MGTGSKYNEDCGDPNCPVCVFGEDYAYRVEASMSETEYRASEASPPSAAMTAERKPDEHAHGCAIHYHAHAKCTCAATAERKLTDPMMDEQIHAICVLLVGASTRTTPLTMVQAEDIVRMIVTAPNSPFAAVREQDEALLRQAREALAAVSTAPDAPWLSDEVLTSVDNAFAALDARLNKEPK